MFIWPGGNRVRQEVAAGGLLVSRLRTPLRDGGHGSSGFSGWLQQAMHGVEEIFDREGFAEKRVRQLLDLRDISAVGFTPGQPAHGEKPTALMSRRSRRWRTRSE